MERSGTGSFGLLEIAWHKVKSHWKLITQLRDGRGKVFRAFSKVKVAPFLSKDARAMRLHRADPSTYLHERTISVGFDIR